MPLRVSFSSDFIHPPNMRRWEDASLLTPRDMPGMLQDTPPDAPRQLYIYACRADDTSSVIVRMRSLSELIVYKDRILVPPNIEMIKELRRVDPPFDITITMEDSFPIMVRFTHE
jgi:hypothetical protein